MQTSITNTSNLVILVLFQINDWNMENVFEKLWVIIVKFSSENILVQGSIQGRFSEINYWNIGTSPYDCTTVHKNTFNLRIKEYA